MNKLSLFFIIIFTGLISVNAQKKNAVVFEKPEIPVDETTKKITYSKVVEASGTKDQLYKKALGWYNRYYKNPTNVIREKDAANGRILGKARIKILNPPDKKGVQTMKGIVVYTIICELKDGRFKYTISDINLKSTSYYPCEKWLDTDSQTYSQVYNFFLKQVDEEVKKTIKSLVSAMTISAEKKQEDW